MCILLLNCYSLSAQRLALGVPVDVGGFNIINAQSDEIISNVTQRTYYPLQSTHSDLNFAFSSGVLTRFEYRDISVECGVNSNLSRFKMSVYTPINSSGSFDYNAVISQMEFRFPLSVSYSVANIGSNRLIIRTGATYSIPFSLSEYYILDNNKKYDYIGIAEDHLCQNN